MAADTVEQGAKWTYRVGGISALALAIGYIVIIPLYLAAGAPPPSEGEAWLKYAAGKTSVWWAIVGLSVLTDLLFIPVAWALYLALRGVSRNAMQLGTALVVLFVVLDLAVTWPNIATLITLTDSYAAATIDVQRAAYVAAATYATAVLKTALAGVYSIVTLSVGILLIGLVMLRANFSRTAAYLGVATGILGIVSVAGPLLVGGLSAIVIVASALTTAWVVFVGYRLYRLSQQ